MVFEEMLVFALSKSVSDVSIRNSAGLILPSEEQLSPLPLAQLCICFMLTHV